MTMGAMEPQVLMDPMEVQDAMDRRVIVVQLVAQVVKETRVPLTTLAT